MENIQYSVPLDKIGMMIRGALNKKLAEDLKYTSHMNEILVKHYRNYPDTQKDL